MRDASNVCAGTIKKASDQVEKNEMCGGQNPHRAKETAGGGEKEEIAAGGEKEKDGGGVR